MQMQYAFTVCRGLIVLYFHGAFLSRTRLERRDYQSLWIRNGDCASGRRVSVFWGIRCIEIKESLHVIFGIVAGFVSVSGEF